LKGLKIKKVKEKIFSLKKNLIENFVIDYKEGELKVVTKFNFI
jgi:hypothetical protein